MNKRFKSYSKSKFKLTKYIIYLLIGIISFIITIKILNNNITIPYNSNELLALSSNNLIKRSKLLDLIDITISSPKNLLYLSSGKKITINNDFYQENLAIKQDQEPIIYIYNTHQTEEYQAGSLRNYNLTPTVYMAANILKKRLEEANINAIVEDEDITKVLKEHNWKYKESYYASRLWLENSINKSPSIKYYLDLHRDSTSFSIQINDKPYAKMMFVLGMNHDNYKENENLAIKLNNYLVENYPGLMRNILYSPKNKYNQDFNSNCLLIEVGGPNNTIEEVSNSIDALSKAYEFIIKENYGT